VTLNGPATHAGISAGDRIGAALQTLTPPIAQSVGLEAALKGAIVTEILPGSAAQQAGLMVGDVIRESDRRPVHSADEAAGAVHAGQGPRLLRAWNATGMRFVSATPASLGSRGDAKNGGETKLPAMTAAQVLPTLHAINQVEIEAGRIAQERGSSDTVKQYGATLRRDHETADKNLKQIAGQENVELDFDIPPAAQSAFHNAKGELDNLSTVGGQAFDYEFATTMLEQQQSAIRFVDRARQNVTDPKLKALLDDVEPDLREHEEIAAEILSALAARPGRSDNW
jgi:putative membrane protein